MLMKIASYILCWIKSVWDLLLDGVKPVQEKISAALSATEKQPKTKYESQRIFCPKNQVTLTKWASGHQIERMLKYAVCGSVGQCQSLFSKARLCAHNFDFKSIFWPSECGVFYSVWSVFLICWEAKTLQSSSSGFSEHVLMLEDDEDLQPKSFSSITFFNLMRFWRLRSTHTIVLKRSTITKRPFISADVWIFCTCVRVCVCVCVYVCVLCSLYP